MAEHRIRQGLDLPISGKPTQSISDANTVTQVALIGRDYPTMKPRMHVKEGDVVKRGQLLFEDRKTEGVCFTAPAAGTVQAVNRGEKRSFQSLVISLDSDSQEQVDFEAYKGTEVSALQGDDVRALLSESGLWTSIRTRPFSRIPSPTSTCDALFITAIDTNPLAASVNVVMEGREKAFMAGLQAAKLLTEGKTYLCVGADWTLDTSSISGVDQERFIGPHPAGLVGTHIHMLNPVSRKSTVWHIGYQDIIAMGELFLSGQYNTDRVISLAGPVVTNPRLLRTTMGACLSEITGGELAEDVETRTISGSVIHGHQSEDATPEDVDGFIVDTVEEYELLFRKRLAMGHELVRNPEPPLLIGFYDATADERWMMYIEDYKTSGDLKKQKEIQDMDDDAFEEAYAAYQAKIDANAEGKPYDYLNRYDVQVSCLAEDRERVFLGWLRLGAEKFSTVRTYLSGWKPRKDFDLTTTTNGSHRAMVPIGMFERVMPLDIMPTFLLRSLLVGDLERAEQLGCLELHEEDLALCSFVSPGKESYGKALRNVLTEIWQEG